MQKKAKKGSAVVLSALCIALSYCILTIIIGIATMPVRYDIRIGMVSPVTITATKDVVDTVQTNARKDAAAKQVEPSYVQDSAVAPEVLSQLEQAFPSFVALGVAEGSQAPEEITEQMLAQAAETIAPAAMSTNARLEALMKTSQATLQALADQTIQRVRAQLNLNIAEGHENEAISSIQKELVSAGWDSILAASAADMLRPFLRANMIVDVETTEANREAARAEVEDVVYIKGQNIVRSGEIVTRAQLEMLNSLGLLQEQGVDVFLLSSVGVLVAVLMGLLVIYLVTFEKELLHMPRQVLLLMSILTLTVLLCWAVTQFNVYLMPTILGVMLICYLMKPRLALMASDVIAVCAGLIASGATGSFTAVVFTTVINTLVAGSLSIAIIMRRKGRTGVLIAGFLCGVANIITSMAIGLINNAIVSTVLVSACWTGGSAILASVLCIGVQPVLESLFNLTTSAKLFDLTNPNQPLLRRLLLEAPGTYHHSIMVANLAEEAANAIGANALLARVGAYYHDIGKLKRPLYFKENQLGDNPHDRTDPRVSASILLAHPGDGVQLAAKEHIPEEVRNIIARHHGHTMVVYFYDKAIKQSGAENVDPADFTYDAPLPQTREEAIVMLADPVEAASRTLPSRDRQSISDLIDKLVSNRMQDGDLDDCYLTFADIAKIKEAFVTVMTGMYHERIEYPDPPPKHTWQGQKLFGKANDDKMNEMAKQATEKNTGGKHRAAAPKKEHTKSAQTKEGKRE